eukprot:COSAG02_NODE_3304_length_6976_cov_6.587902_3_plen_92_part_00
MPDENEVAPEIVYDPTDKKEREKNGMEQYQKYYLEEQESDDGNDVTETDNGESTCDCLRSILALVRSSGKSTSSFWIPVLEGRVTVSMTPL